MGRGPPGLRREAGEGLDDRRSGRGHGPQLAGLGAGHARPPRARRAARGDRGRGRRRDGRALRRPGRAAHRRRRRRSSAASAATYPLGVASSAHPRVIEAALRTSGLRRRVPGGDLVGRGRRTASRRPMCTSSPPSASACRPPPASSSRIRSTASWRPSGRDDRRPRPQRGGATGRRAPRRRPMSGSARIGELDPAAIRATTSVG